MKTKDELYEDYVLLDEYFQHIKDNNLVGHPAISLIAIMQELYDTQLRMIQVEEAVKNLSQNPSTDTAL